MRLNGKALNLTSYEHWDPLIRHKLDPCPHVQGMLSIKKQQLLNLGFSLLDSGEENFEVSAYHAKSL